MFVLCAGLQEGNTIFVRRKKGTYFSGNNYRGVQVKTTNMPVLYHSNSIWSIGTASNNHSMLNPALGMMSCTRNRSRCHRSPAVGHWKHHLIMAVSGRQPGKVFSCSTAFEGTTMDVQTLQVFPMTSRVGFAKCNG